MARDISRPPGQIYLAWWGGAMNAQQQQMDRISPHPSPDGSNAAALPPNRFGAPPNRQERSMIEKTSNEHHLHVSLHDITPEHAAGAGVIKPGYAPRLSNEDLAPLKKQTWSAYNFFAFWMSDVHSVGGYVTAGSLFALGLASWQVLIALLVGITIVYFLCNLVAKPSQQSGVPYPVISRTVFGVLGANIPAIIRGLIAVAWYGIQTYLASAALDVVLLKLFPGLA